MGIKFLLSVWDGVCAVDALEARSRMIRPYEKHPGHTDVIYRNALAGVCEHTEHGKSVMSVLKKAKKEFDAVETDHKNRKPRIGIVGEIYVRSQDFSNTFLINKLENLGCEVVIPSIGEWFFYTNFTRERNCRWFHQYRRAIFSRMFDTYMKWRQRKIYRLMGIEEAPVHTLLAMAQKFIHDSFEGETILTIGKTIECIRDDCAGVVNVMPFTCMPGNIVTTLYKAVKEEHPDFPLFVLSLDGLEHAVDSMRLETFVSQARNYHIGRMVG
jgi:predicted nucleotide-binding protein (sugar kinase/HSP70/actin superfamily)